VKDPLKMMRQVQQMQEKMNKVQVELETDTVEGTAGGGAVSVIATGTQKVVSVTIDPAAASDTEMLQDLVVAAVNEAMEKSKQLALVIEATQLGERDVPDYLEVDHSKMTAKFARIPHLNEVPYPVQMEPHLIVEYYSR